MTLSSETSESYQSSEFKENLEILRNITFFSGIPLEKLKVFAYICIREMFKQDEYLFRQGENDGQAFYLLSGKVSLVYTGDEGEDEIRSYEPGEFLGGLTLLSDTRRIFSMKALDEVSCLIFTREKFMSTIQQFPDLTLRLIRPLAERISEWEGRFAVSREKDCNLCKRRLGVSLL